MKKLIAILVMVGMIFGLAQGEAHAFTSELGFQNYLILTVGIDSGDAAYWAPLIFSDSDPEVRNNWLAAGFIEGDTDLPGLDITVTTSGVTAIYDMLVTLKAQLVGLGLPGYLGEFLYYDAYCNRHGRESSNRICHR